MFGVTIYCDKCHKKLFDSNVKCVVKFFSVGNGACFCTECADMVHRKPLYIQPQMKNGTLTQQEKKEIESCVDSGLPIEIMSILLHRTEYVLTAYIRSIGKLVPNAERPEWMIGDFLFFNGCDNTIYDITPEERLAWRHAQAKANTTIEEIANAYGRPIEVVSKHLCQPPTEDVPFSMPKLHGGALSTANKAKAEMLARNNVPIDVISLITRNTINTVRHYLDFKGIPIPKPKRPEWMVEGFLFFNGYTNTEYTTGNREMLAWEAAQKAGASTSEIARAYGRPVQEVEAHFSKSEKSGGEL